MSKYNYPATIQPLTSEEGGGYLVSFPDLPGCVADGATPEEAFHTLIVVSQLYMDVLNGITNYSLAAKTPTAHLQK